MEWKAKRVESIHDRMEREMQRLTWFLVIILLMPLVSVNNRNMVQNDSESIHPPIYQTSQEISPVIYINTNNGFETIGFPGEGTESNPYILANLRFSTLGYGISITGTDVYFIIRNCTFEGGGTGVRFILVENGYIENCTFDGVVDGIEYQDVSLCKITDSMFTDGNGIRLIDAMNCSLENLVFDMDATDTAIICRFSENVIISNINITSIHNAATYGIQIGESSNIQLDKISITNVDRGIEVEDSYSVALLSVSVVAFDTAIAFQRSTNCLLSDSTLLGNNRHVRLFESISCGIIRTKFESYDHAQIVLDESEFCLILDCQLVNSSLIVQGENLGHMTHTVLNTTSKGKKIGFFRNLNTTNVDASEFHQVFIINSERVNITNSNRSSTLFSLDVFYSNDCVLENLTITDHVQTRVLIDESTRIQIIKMRINKAWRGLQVRDSASVNITDLEMDSCGAYISRSVNVFVERSNLDLLTFSESNFCLLQDSNITTLSLDACNRGDFINLQIVNPVEVFGFYFADWEHAFENVFVSGKLLGFFYNYHLIDIDAVDYGQVYLAYCSGISIRSSSPSEILRIDATYCDEVHIENVLIGIGWSNGISLEVYTDVILDSTQFSGNNTLSITGSNNVTLSNCSIYESFVIVTGYANYRIHDCFFKDCIVSVYDTLNLEFIRNVIESSIGDGMYLDNPRATTISNNTVIASRDGIRVYTLSECNITMNHIECERYGIYLRDISNTTIAYNQIYGTRVGVNITTGYASIILANQVYFSTVNGIQVSGFATSVIEKNLIYGTHGDGIYSGNGMFFEESQMLQVSLNVLIENQGYGIFLQGTYGSTFWGNLFENNSEGDAYQYGIQNEWNGNCWINKWNETDVELDGPSISTDNSPLTLVSYDSPIPMLTDFPDLTLSYDNRTVEVYWIIWTFSEVSIRLTHNNGIVSITNISEPTIITYTLANLTAGLHNLTLAVYVDDSFHISDSAILNMMETNPLLITALAGFGIVCAVAAIEFRRRLKISSEDATTGDVTAPSTS